MNVADITRSLIARQASHMLYKLLPTDLISTAKGFQAVKDALLHAREAYHVTHQAFYVGIFRVHSHSFFTLTLGTVLHYLYYKLPMPLTLTQISLGAITLNPITRIRYRHRKNIR